jgi:hydrogenase expression/formation protein HypD
MEFCGGHTHAIRRFGIPDLLPQSLELRAGPGCPVCVTSAAEIDRAIGLALVPEVILVTFGDMIRVPGSSEKAGQGRTLAQAKAQGADVRIVYSPLDGVALARENPLRPVIFLGVGFETTAPMVASSLLAAQAESLDNYFVFSTHKLTPPAMRAVLEGGEVALDGVIGPGHVTTVIGSEAWGFLAEEYAMPCAVAGFEPLDILRSVLALVEMAEEGRCEVVTVYERSVSPQGNLDAQEAMSRVFEVVDVEWRGFGTIPGSGLRLRDDFAALDAWRVFQLELPPAREPAGCRCGDVLRGVLLPTECGLFGRVCNPGHPVGPCMVSSEGACAAHYRYGGELGGG